MKRKDFLTILYSVGLVLLSGQAVYAQPRFDGIVDIFNDVMALVFPLGGLVALGMIVYGGYMWMIGGDDPGKIKQAQGVLTWAVIGLIFLAVFGLLLKLLMDFLK